MRLLTLTENNFNRKGVLGMKKSLAGIIAFLIIISAFSVTAFAADKINAYDGLKSSYYEDKSALYGNEIEIADSYETLGVRAKAKTDELIPIYRTDTDSKEKLEKMFEEISAGKSLESFLVPKNEYFAYAYDDSGKVVGYCILSADKLEVQEVGELNEYTNRAFKMTAKSEKALKKSLDLNSASAKYCIISGFAAGTLVYDENSEFFIPSADSLDSEGALTANAVYSVSELGTIFETKMPEPAPNSLDKDGNPYTGAAYYENAGAGKSDSDKYVAAALFGCSVIFAAAAIFQIKGGLTNSTKR